MSRRMKAKRSAQARAARVLSRIAEREMAKIAEHKRTMCACGSGKSYFDCHYQKKLAGASGQR